MLTESPRACVVLAPLWLARGKIVPLAFELIQAATNIRELHLYGTLRLLMLRALGLQTAESQSNFCWLHLGEDRDEAEIMRGLAERGVLVRGGRDLGSDTPVLRVTYGLPEENERFLQALADVLSPAPTP